MQGVIGLYDYYIYPIFLTKNSKPNVKSSNWKICPSTED